MPFPDNDGILRYSLLPSIGPTRGRALIHAFGAFENLRRVSVLDIMRVNGFSKILAGTIRAAVRGEASRSLIERTVKTNRKIAEAMNAEMISCFDARYPILLKDIYDPPLFLFVH